jgi:hypothetical protein
MRFEETKLRDTAIIRLAFDISIRSIGKDAIGPVTASAEFLSKYPEICDEHIAGIMIVFSEEVYGLLGEDVDYYLTILKEASSLRGVPTENELKSLPNVSKQSSIAAMVGGLEGLKKELEEDLRGDNKENISASLDAAEGVFNDIKRHVFLLTPSGIDTMDRDVEDSINDFSNWLSQKRLDFEKKAPLKQAKRPFWKF